MSLFARSSTVGSSSQNASSLIWSGWASTMQARSAARPHRIAAAWTAPSTRLPRLAPATV